MLKSRLNAGPQAASMLKQVIDKKGKYKELNALQALVKELEIKNENQSILYKNSQIQVKALEEKLSFVLGDESSSENHGKKMIRLEQENIQLRSQHQTLVAENESLQHVVKDLRSKYDELKTDNEGLSKMQEVSLLELDEAKSGLQSQQSEGEAFQALIKKQEEELIETKSKLEDYAGLFQAKEQLVRQVEQLIDERTNMNEELTHLRAQVFDQAQRANHKQNELQNSLQGTRQFLEELKLEYEEFSAVKLSELETLQKDKENIVNKLTSRYEMLLQQSKENEIRHQKDQEDIVKALQSQFREYREVAESLFYREAENLEVKLRQQTLAYEEEIRFIIMAKDQYFNHMITSKDAKIMNLIDGTDFQKILVKHRMEKETLIKNHERDLQMVRDAVTGEQQKYISNLKNDNEKKDSLIEKYQNQLLSWDKKLESTVRSMKLSQNINEQKEDNLASLNRETQIQLDEAYKKIEDLIQNNENLKHQILRLHLTLEGKNDSTIDSMIRKLMVESETLKKDMSVLSFNHNKKVKDTSRLELKLSHAHKIIQVQEKNLHKQKTEYDTLTQTFESFLHGRLRRITGSRLPIRDSGIQHLLHSLSPEMTQALYQERLAGKDEKIDDEDDNININNNVNNEQVIIYDDADDDSEEESRNELNARMELIHQAVKNVPEMKPSEEFLPSNSSKNTIPEFPEETQPQSQLITTTSSDNNNNNNNNNSITPRAPSSSDGKQRSQMYSPRNRKYGKHPKTKFRMPKALRLLQQNNELVDVASIMQIQDGFEKLKLFKQTSARFAKSASIDPSTPKINKRPGMHISENKNKSNKEMKMKDNDEYKSLLDATIKVRGDIRTKISKDIYMSSLVDDKYLNKKTIVNKTKEHMKPMIEELRVDTVKLQPATQ